MPFDHIVGNEKVKELLTNMVKSGKILHSYMLIGEEGIGKKEFAKEFAKMVLCFSKDRKPCDICKSCLEMQEQNHPDFMMIEPDGNNIKIEQIRMFQTKVIEKPIISNHKFYIINDAEKMTTEAQNCLLKTLEEPPEYITIILITSNENKIVNTIRSRCMKIQFLRLKEEEIKKILKEQYQMNVESSSLLNFFEGSLKKAIELKENKELYEKVEEVFTKIEDMTQLELIDQAEIIYKSKEQIDFILEYINVILYENAKKSPNKRENYMNCIRIVEEVKKRIGANSNYDMSIDFLLFKIWEELNS